MDILKQPSDFDFLCLKHGSMLSLPGFEIDSVHRKVYCGNKKVNLTAKEYALLCLLVANEGCVLTYDQIYRKIWKEEVFGSTNNAIKCHVQNLREKLRKVNSDASFSIRCVREVGYCFEVATKEKITSC